MAPLDKVLAGGVDAGEYVFTYDANGNVAQVLDLSADSAAAAIVAHYEYDPYGGVVNDLSCYTYAEANPIRFSTKYHDAETGLGYWRPRRAPPRLGRWLSRDPLEERGGLNLYAYVLNSPTSAVDPLGQMCLCTSRCSLPEPPVKGDCSSCWSTCTSAAGQSMATIDPPVSSAR
jgi:RHS repeat-associated protein